MMWLANHKYGILGFLGEVWWGWGWIGSWLQVAERFVYQAFENDGLPSVLWVVQLDPRGATSVVYRCKQARPFQLCI
jgi:hypothetical protein